MTVPTNNVKLLMDADISDPSDFPKVSIRPGLRDLDSAMRCGICQDFYDAPVTLACGHCFCSLCVRDALALKDECPQCRKTSSDVHIRPNPSLEQAVQAWRDARPCILKLLGEAQDLLARLNSAQSHNLSSPQPNKKRKREQNDVRRSPSVELIDDDHQRGDVAESSSKGVASCPICSKPVLLHNINAHLDSGCVQHLVKKDKKDKPKDKPKAVAAWQNILTGEKKGKGKERSGSQDGPSDPLPKLAYNTVKDKVIKDRLSEWDLPTTGDKGTLIARHKHWVMLFNANLDKSEKHQRSLKELRRELRIWEEGQKLKKIVVEDPVAHEKRYDGEFKALVAAARPAPRLAQARSPSESSALPPSSPHTRSSPSDGSPNSPSEDEPAS